MFQQERLRIGSKRHDVTAVNVTDPREMALPSLGLIELEDAETGEVILVDTHDLNITRGFELLGKQERDGQTDLFRSSDVGEIQIRTDQSYIDPIVRYFRTKGH